MDFTLEKIDHVHVFVNDRDAAEKWYQQVLGLARVAELEAWSVDGGPLTIGNANVHLALFEGGAANKNVVALRVPIERFPHVRKHLESLNVDYVYEDHNMSVSVYLTDPDGNRYEITAYR